MDSNFHPPGRLLGGFEHMVLLALQNLGETYGVPIRRQILEQTGRDVSVGALYTTLDRLERRGLVSSFNESAAHHGGRRVFRLEAPGVRALAETATALNAMGLGPNTRIRAYGKTIPAAASG